MQVGSTPEQTSDEEFSYVEDGQGRRLRYLLRLANEPKTARTLIILHGHTYLRPSRFRDARWNVVVPVDTFGLDGKGSWWLGEHGDPFMIPLMKALVDEIEKKIGSKLDLYLWGSSMGGYGAMLHGMLLGATAVFAIIPQTKIFGTHYGESITMHDYFKFVAPQPKYNDLVLLMNHQIVARAKMPLFFISSVRFDYDYYLNEQILRFVSACIKDGINYYLEILPRHGHGITRTVPESLRIIDANLASP